MENNALDTHTQMEIVKINYIVPKMRSCSAGSKREIRRIRCAQVEKEILKINAIASEH